MIYLDSEDPFYSEKVESNPVLPSKPIKKKDYAQTHQENKQCSYQTEWQN